MRNTRRTNHYQKTRSPKKNTGFYIALAICIVTIAAAAWTTYGSLLEYTADDDQAEPSAAATDQELSGEYAPSDAEPSPTPDGSDTAENTSSSQEAQPVNTEETNSSDDTAESPDSSEDSEPSGNVYSDAIDGGVIIKPFSLSDLLYSKTTSDWRTHCGIDIAANEGTAVHAIEDGVIRSMTKDPLYGNIITVDHGSCTARYCGMTDTPVITVGTNVSSGDTIGYLGTIPCESLDGSHLHLELISDNTYLPLEALPALSK